MPETRSPNRIGDIPDRRRPPTLGSPERGVWRMGPDKVEKLCQKAQLAIAQRDWVRGLHEHAASGGLFGDQPEIAKFQQVLLE